MRNPFARAPRALDAEDTESAGGDLAENGASQKRQQLILYGGGGVLAVMAMVWILAPDAKETKSLDQIGGAREVKVSTDDIVNQRLSGNEWMAMSENQLRTQSNQIRGLEGQVGQIEQMQSKIDALEGEKQSMAADGTRVLSAYESENQELRNQLATAQRAPTPGPTGLYGAGAPATYQQRGGKWAPQAGAGAGAGAGADGEPGAAPAPVTRANEIKLVSFGGENAGTANRIGKGSTTFTDSANYLPPNSIARAKVVVGVDATTSVKSQSDPLPVVLRITGPARSVYAEGRLLRTNIEGCMVNGAAQGDLSSEKVYVRLQRMTCPQPGGRFAVSEVKGFISFGGKTGVRGRVVSREGGLVTQSFIAGLAGGFGRGFSANTSSLLTGNNVTVNGKREQLSLGDIAQGGLGEGIATSADAVSKYLIERAEQYQPVIEMPTGVDVEIVFLDGVFIRN